MHRALEHDREILLFGCIFHIKLRFFVKSLRLPIPEARFVTLEFDLFFPLTWVFELALEAESSLIGLETSLEKVRSTTCEPAGI